MPVQGDEGVLYGVLRGLAVAQHDDGEPEERGVVPPEQHLDELGARGLSASRQLPPRCSGMESNSSGTESVMPRESFDRYQVVTAAPSMCGSRTLSRPI